MTKNLVAEAGISINAPRHKVWKALITRQALKQYMFGADVESDWREGSPITWKGEMGGKKYSDKGVVLEVKPERTLRYSHFSPLSGKPDEPANYHNVTIALSGGSSIKVEFSDTQKNQKRVEGRADFDALGAVAFGGDFSLEWFQGQTPGQLNLTSGVANSDLKLPQYETQLSDSLYQDLKAQILAEKARLEAGNNTVKSITANVSGFAFNEETVDVAGDRVILDKPHGLQIEYSLSSYT